MAKQTHFPHRQVLSTPCRVRGLTGDALNRISVPLRTLCLEGCDFKLVKELKNLTAGLKHLSLSFWNLWACEYSLVPRP